MPSPGIRTKTPDSLKEKLMRLTKRGSPCFYDLIKSLQRIGVAVWIGAGPARNAANGPGTGCAAPKGRSVAEADSIQTFNKLSPRREESA